MKIENFASKKFDDAMLLTDTVRNVIRIHELRWKCDDVVEFVCGKMCKQQKIQFKPTLIFTWIRFFFMRIGLGLYIFQNLWIGSMLWNGWIHCYNMHIVCIFYRIPVHIKIVHRSEKFIRWTEGERVERWYGEKYVHIKCYDGQHSKILIDTRFSNRMLIWHGNRSLLLFTEIWAISIFLVLLIKYPPFIEMENFIRLQFTKYQMTSLKMNAHSSIDIIPERNIQIKAVETKSKRKMKRKKNREQRQQESKNIIKGHYSTIKCAFDRSMVNSNGQQSCKSFYC